MDDGIKKEYLRSTYRVVYIEQNYAEARLKNYHLLLPTFQNITSIVYLRVCYRREFGGFYQACTTRQSSMKFKTDETITKIAMESGYETSASLPRLLKKQYLGLRLESLEKLTGDKGEAMLEAKFVDFDAVECFISGKPGLTRSLVVRRGKC